MQYTRCGKTTCRCREGSLHGPYYYRVWREGDVVRKDYVRRDRLAEMQAGCDAYKALMDHLKQSRQKRVQIEKSIRGEWRRGKVSIAAKAD
nr:DUF6788 family protein [Capsulimonas corticalis]